MGWTGGPFPVFMRTVVSGYGGIQPMPGFNVLKNDNVNAFRGASIFVGIGNDDQDMVANGQYREIWMVGQAGAY